jgi:hypothetical protein
LFNIFGAFGAGKEGGRRADISGVERGVAGVGKEKGAPQYFFCIVPVPAFSQGVYELVVNFLRRTALV